LKHLVIYSCIEGFAGLSDTVWTSRLCYWFNRSLSTRTSYSRWIHLKSAVVAILFPTFYQCLTL